MADNTTVLDRSKTVAGMTEYGPLKHVAVCPPSVCYVDQATCDRTWESDLFLGCPDYARSVEEHAQFVELLGSRGARVDMLPSGPGTSLSAIYARDSSIVSPSGVIIGKPANPPRLAEADLVESVYTEMGLPIAGRITGDGLLEGGDVMWIDERTIAVAHGCRTNAEGIRQMSEILGPDIDVIVVGLPYWEGPSICVHLMSFISPLAADLALVYPRLMPVPFREYLLDRGMRFVEVPDEEYDPGLACNVLALEPGVCLAIERNTITRSRLEAAGCEVLTYPGEEISVKGGGGPTCLTRPFLRG